MQIDLIRHAKDDLESSQKIDASALREWVKAYDIAPIIKTNLPPRDIKSNQKRSNHFDKLTSTNTRHC